MQLTPAENTPGNWGGIIDDLTTKRQAAHRHLEQLRAQKRELALEAAMGGGDAKKRLEKTNAELSKLAFEIDDWDVAITQAQAAKEQAEKSAAEAAERARQEELSVLAATAVRHAAEFSASLRQAVKVGATLKMVIANMLGRATPDERPYLSRLLEAGPFMRAAEHAGLKAHMEFQGYPGPRDHVVALEDALAILLDRWLKLPARDDPPEGSGN